MASRLSLFTTLMAVASVTATSLVDLCTVANVKDAIPSNSTFNGITFYPSQSTANVVYNSSATEGMSTTTTKYNYCNITIVYTHTGRNDSVTLLYALPDPSQFSNRFYVAGGEAYSLASTATGGLPYGAVGGITSAGYNAFVNAYDDVALLANGTINWDATYEFAYQALGETTIVGKAFTKNIYCMSNSTKLYTYFEGCSDGGRQAMSQVQRWGVEYDGVVAGAPAFRYAQQQTNHLFSALVEYTQGYYPPPCELDKIVNATIAACDPLDGKTDGVVSRTDLCMLEFNLSSIIGTPYYCAATDTTTEGLGYGKNKRQNYGGTSESTPAQNGTVSAKGVAVAQAIYNGLHNSKGQRAYLSWQIAAELEDATTTYNTNTSSWELDITAIGGEYVAKWVELLDIDNIASLEGVTYDTMVGWMQIAFDRYYDSLQTTLPDLTPFQSSGGKLLHYHGESDPSVPTASSVRYYQSVKSIMGDNGTEMDDWYQLYLIPGAAHCAANTLQPDGPYPENNMATMIDWVEKGVKPSYLNGTIGGGPDKGEIQQLCRWPHRPLWSSNSTYSCVIAPKSLKTWTYEFPAFKLPVY